MTAGNRPPFKLVIPKSDEQERTNIGAEWGTAKSDVFSCRIKLPFDLPAGTELSFIRVPNEPKAAPEQQPMSQPAQQTRGPTRTAPRQRTPQGQQPRGAA